MLARGCTDGDVCKNTDDGDLSTNTCVACLDDVHCDQANGEVCDEPTETCVACTKDSECDGDQVCDETGDKGAANACVTCTEASHCTEADAARCNDVGQCDACQVDADCAGVGSLDVCDEGMCVECTEDKLGACGSTSCDPTTNTCTNTQTGTVDTCEPCISDVECQPDHRCIPMEFQGQSLGQAYCLKLVSAGACERPYGRHPAGDSLG